MNRRCSICGFKFQQSPGPGKKAVNCPTCRKDRQDRWKAGKEKRDKPTPKSEK